MAEGSDFGRKAQASRFLKAELKRADVTYEALAKRRIEHGLEETKASITNKLSQGPFRPRFSLRA